MSAQTVRLTPMTEHSFQAHQGGLVFVVRDTTQGWKTEGHPVFDGLRWASKDALLAEVEGRP